MRRSATRAVISILLLALVTSCSVQTTMRRPDPQVVEKVTGGLLSRYATIQVTFTHAMSGDIGTPLASSPFRFNPPLKGVARWADERTLEFVPAGALSPGRAYRVAVNLPKVSSFDFAFTVLASHFEVALGSLSLDDGKDTTYHLDGTLTTADREEPARVEKLVSANLAGKSLAVTWQHGSDPRSHSFRVTGIERAARAQAVAVSWSGRAIASRAAGRRLLTVPARGVFQVMAVRAVQADQRFIEVSFSSILKPSQSLDGLLRVSGRTDVRTSVDNNIVRLYAQSPWKQSETVTVDPGVQSADSSNLTHLVAQNVAFQDQLPQVRFAGTGVIVPTTQGTTVPIETMNLRAVIVEAFQIFGDDMTQFLQVNTLADSNELYRVGKVVWRQVVPLNFTDDQKNAWVRHGLDLSALIKNHPDGMFQIRVSFRQPHIVWNWGDKPQPAPLDYSQMPLVIDDPNASQSSYWDYWEQDYNSSDYDSRNDPTSGAYYKPWEGEENKSLVVRNVLVSNIGLIAKMEPASGTVYVLSADLRTAQPLSGVKITLQSFPRRPIAAGLTDKQGMVKFTGIAGPSFIVAERAGQFGWLKLDGNSALVTSQFDTSGETVLSGVKGFLYGERGVWRPGDPIYLSFILTDPQKTLPAGHPVMLEMRDPRGQLVSRTVTTTNVDGIYAFTTGTAADAPTGSWEARVKVGDRTFSRSISVESVMPNRIKMEFNVPPATGPISDGAFTADLQADWLYGAPAANLEAKIGLRLSPTPTLFPAYSDFVFDDPSRQFSTGDQDLFDGTTDAQGKATVSGSINVEGQAPGKLSASFLVRVIEPSGAFSSEQFSRELSPYDRYVGIRVPKGDAARGMLLVDTDQAVRIVLVDPNGAPVKSGTVHAEIYKINWRWWWEKGEETQVDFDSSESRTPIQSANVQINNGQGEWKFQIKYPDWGRYLIRVTDPKGGHSTGKVVYIDWPGWAGRAVEGKIGASMLTLSADKTAYKVGEPVTVSFPSNPDGRALVTLEEEGRVLKQEWVAPSKDITRYSFAATPDMAPNIYVHVTFIQPHLQTANDLPIRLYGVVPINVEDPSTHLSPIVMSADTFKPGQKATINVKEATGREMTYTLAIVDEGLLRLNRYTTPDPWNVFYKKEASLLVNWDLYDLVAGAFSGQLDSLLAIGGGEDQFPGGERKANRFPPLVRFIGPVSLKKGATNTHIIDIPQYIGAVRLMVVAAHAGAYGTAERSVTVKSDLMLLPTLPRVLSVGETADFPVSVISGKADMKSANVTVTVTGPVTVVGSPTQTVSLAGAEEKIARFQLKVGSSVGKATVSVTAAGSGAEAAASTEIDVRLPATRQTRVTSATIQQGKTWQGDLSLFGYPGTNGMQIEISRLPPMDLGKNLDYLIQYPHGCIEQTTSSVFPQLYLDKLVQLSTDKAAQTQKNVDAGIKRLTWFQTSSGGFTFWPGYGEADDWGTTYAGHFLLEAQKRGYALPPDMLSKWADFQKLRADAWTSDSPDAAIQQAYRLYTLALDGQADLGAMNRLREMSGLPDIARWRLAAAYQLAGQKDEALRQVQSIGVNVSRYREMSFTYGSDLRDRAMILESMVILGLMDKAQGLATTVSQQLASTDPYATQTTAYALLGLTQYALGSGPVSPLGFSYTWADGAAKAVSGTTPIVQEAVALGSAAKGRLAITNTGQTPLFTRIILQGVPPLGSEKADANGLTLQVAYTSGGEEVDPSTLQPGAELAVEVNVTNTSRNNDYQQVALSYLLPGSWEVTAARVLPDQKDAATSYDYQDIRDDRILTYFSVKHGQSKVFRFDLTVAYTGRFYMPAVSVEAMYDATVHATVPGTWLGGQ